MGKATDLKAEIAAIDTKLTELTGQDGWRGAYAVAARHLRERRDALQDTLDELTERPDDGIYRTVDQLEGCGSFAWPGGYPLGFYPCDRFGDPAGVVLCLDCAKASLEDDNDFGILAEVEDGGQQYYGGVTCDGCGDPIVEPICPECGDSLFDGTALMHADTVDASLLHRHCAAAMVYRSLRASVNDGTEHPSDIRGPHAVRRPGLGIEIIAEPGCTWSSAPWYAPVGTIYRYR